jgi:hypothetical protein
MVRRVVVVLLALAVLTAGGVTFANEVQATQEDTAAVRGSALALHAERVRVGTVLASTREQLQRTWDERTSRRAERVTLDRRLQALYGRLLGVNERLNELVRSSALHVLSLDATKRCLFGVRRATEQASVDDYRGASASLDSVSGSCRTANAAGRST